MALSKPHELRFEVGFEVVPPRKSGPPQHKYNPVDRIAHGNRNLDR
jgi:hypothetical protein